LLYGFRVWALKQTYAVLVVQGLVTGGLIAEDASHGTQEWGELFEVPLMSAMFLAMVWHARRHRAAAEALARHTEERGAVLARQERFLHDASHELRTPITIARGHLAAMVEATSASRSRSTSSRGWSESSSACCSLPVPATRASQGASRTSTSTR
jgi:signal transduction histidine kinase